MNDNEPIENADEFTRDELDTLAADEGIEQPEKLKTKADVVAAINESRAARATGASDAPAPALNSTAQVTALNPTAESVFGGETPLGSTLAFDTSEFQPKGDAVPIYGDARTRSLVDPNARRVDGGGTVNKADDNRDK